MRDRELILFLMVIATVFWIITASLAAFFYVDLSNAEVRAWHFSESLPVDPDPNGDVVSLFWLPTAVYAMVMIFLLIGLAMNMER